MTHQKVSHPVPATLPTDVIPANTTDLAAKLQSFSRAGASSVHVIFDFDRTLTVNKPGSGDEVTTWHIVDRHLPPEGQQKSQALYQKYRAIELSGELTTQTANEWWSASLQLYATYRVNLPAIEDDFLNKASIRPGVAELFAYCAAHDIPTVILSAGIRDVIEIWCRHYHIEPSLIISTALTLDSVGNITGWQADSLVHVLNKSEATHEELHTIRAQRPNTFLVGDGLDDASMASGADNVIRIRVLDPRADETATAQEMVKTFQRFDAIIESGTFDGLRELVAAVTAD